MATTGAKMAKHKQLSLKEAATMVSRLVEEAQAHMSEDERRERHQAFMKSSAAVVAKAKRRKLSAKRRQPAAGH